MDKQERKFWRTAVVVFALFTGGLYFPVFLGKVPFPRDLVLQFPAWAGRIQPDAMRSYADIGDLITFFYPTRAFAAQAVKQGVLPLWNPMLLSGEPFLANNQSSLFYPLNIPYYVLPLPIAWTICLMLRMFLAALFMAMFVRSSGGSKTGTVFAGIVFASCGFMTAWQGQPITDSAIWLPFACYAINKLYRNVSGIWVALAAAGFAMPILAGHPETAAHVTLTGSTLAAMLWLFPPQSNKPRFDRRFFTAFAFVGLLALGLASVQMIPTLEWLKQMGESLDAWPSLPPIQALGWVSRDILRSPNSAGVNIPEAAAYMAMLSILAVPLAAFHRPRVYPVFLFAVAACAIAIAYGFEPMHTLVAHIPIFRALKNFRMLVANFAIAGLAGLGISVLEQHLPSTRKQRLIAVASVGTMFLLTLELIHQLQLATTFKAEVMHRPSFSRTLLIVSLVVIGWRLFGGLRGRSFPILVCALAVFDLSTFAFGYTGFANRDEVFPPSPAFDFLVHRDNSQFRVIQLGFPYPPNTPLMYGLQSADGYEIGFSNRQRAFWGDLIHSALETNGINFVLDSIVRKTDRRLDLFNVKYVVLPGFIPDYKRVLESDRFVEVFNNREVAIFENPSFLPRACVVPASGIETFRRMDAEIDRVKNAAFDPHKFVTISETASQPAAAANATAS